MKRICNLFLFVALLFVLNHRTSAQTFVLVYNIHGKKIGTGTLELIADTVIVIENKKKQLQRFLVVDISFIKTQRSVGSYLISGFGIGLVGSSFIAKGAAYVGVENEALGVIMISGTAVGTIAGFVIGIATKRQKFIINADPERWKALGGYWPGLLANDL